MRVILKQKNLSLTPSIREYIERKLVEPVRKIMRTWAENNLPILEIEIARTTMHHRKGIVYYAEVNAAAGKRFIRVEAEDVDIHAAIDALKDEFEARLKVLKEKQVARERRGARAAKEAARSPAPARKRRSAGR